MGIALTEPALGFGVKFADLYGRDGLARLDHAFLDHLRDADDALADRLAAARAAPGALAALEEAALILALCPHLDDFLGRLFAVGGELAELAARQNRLAPLFACKRLFIQRRAAKAMTPADAARLDAAEVEAALALHLGGAWDELAFATRVMEWQADEAGHGPALKAAERYAAWALHSAPGRARHGRGHLFQAPGKQDPLGHVKALPVPVAGLSALAFPPERLRRRDGFSLTDPGCDLTGALDEIHTCILCHHQGKDSCSKGLRDKKTGAFARNPVGLVQAGCPLEERISEMQEAKAAGFSIGALAIAAIDNPMLAGTGHRICNDCMAACVFTNGNRQPVNIPEVESRILKDVLALPWGVEIYGLLTRWNPLDIRRPLPRPATGRTVLVVGMGPAGYTLAHHLLNEGHAVVAIDALKIEPLAPSLSGIEAAGRRVPFKAVRDMADLEEDLGSRVMAGFGGVAEYGITVRWNKNNLKILRLLLERRAEFLMLGGVRLGGTLTLADASARGFDHVALCMGAGRPTIVDIPGKLAKGVRQASDFLMALQLTGAGRPDSVANLQLRLPALVIGGGLTAIDSATEALAYYPLQVEKFLSRFETLAAGKGDAAVMADYRAEEAEIAAEFLAHGRAIRAERARAAAEGRAPDLLSLLNQWGGVSVVYRRKLVESPAYRNHEEVIKALEEGIRFIEGQSPVAVETDAFGAVGLRVRDAAGVETILPARAVIVAAGTVPNTVLAREEAGLALDGRHFQAVDEAGEPVSPERLAKPGLPLVLMRRAAEPPRLSFFGDLHPSFAGNVVSAMASAKQGYPVVSRVLAREAPRSTPEALFQAANEDFRATIHAVNRLGPAIVEVVVKAAAAARAFQPGQFYRLQNFETLAARKGGTVLAMEGLALTGAEVDRALGLVSLIVLEMGGSSSLCADLKPGEPVILMGPTGAPTETPSGETVLLAGGGLGNAVLFSIGQALRRAGSRVLYFAGYRSGADLFKRAEIEAAADAVVWCVDSGAPIAPARPQDRSFVGTIVEAMIAYAEGGLGERPLPLGAVARVVAIGSDGMMRAVAAARHGALAAHLPAGHHAIGSINSPMQCMMKEVCAQCLQRHVDPASGAETVVFSCANQDQPLDAVDFASLKERLGQNAVQEVLTRHWIAHLNRITG